MAHYNLTDKQKSKLLSLIAEKPASKELDDIKEALRFDKTVFVITQENISEFAQSEPESYNQDNVETVIEQITSGDIDFDWYETVQDALKFAKETE